MFALVAAWGDAWRRPLRALEVWSGAHELVATLPAELVLQLILHYLQGAALQERVRAQVATTPLPLPPPVVRKPLRALRDRRLRGLAQNGG